MRKRETKEPEIGEVTEEREVVRTRKKLPKKTVVAILWLVVLAMFAGVLIYGFYQWKIKPGKRFRYYGIVNRVERMDAGSTKYCQFGANMLKYNRDGVSVLDGKGTILWTAAYNMQNPQVSVAGDYVAVADIGAKQLYVYDPKGGSTELSILSDIMQISVSEQGEVAVLMQEDGANRIQIYDPYAPGEKKKVEILTYEKEDGYALAIALSKDGAKLVTSYFHVNGNRLDSNLTFYSFTGVGQGANADRIVGIFPYEETLFSELCFMDNNTVYAAGDDRLEVFSMKQKPESMWKLEYDQKLLRTCYSSDYLALLMENEDSGAAGVLNVYERTGAKTASRKVPFSSLGIGIQGEDFFAYSEKDCLILRPGGKLKYEGEFQENVQYMTAGGVPNQFFLVTGQYIEEMRLKEKAEE